MGVYCSANFKGIIPIVLILFCEVIYLQKGCLYSRLAGIALEPFSMPKFKWTWASGLETASAMAVPEGFELKFEQKIAAETHCFSRYFSLRALIS